MKRLLLFFIPLMLFAGCQEDRSGLLSAQTSKELQYKISEAKRLSDAGLCFDALEVADRAKLQVLSEIQLDRKLQKNIVRGIILLQGRIQDECVPIS